MHQFMTGSMLLYKRFWKLLTFVLVGSIVCLCQNSHAQEENLLSVNGFFEAKVGFKHSRLFDELGSNLQYRGFSIPVSLGYFTINDRKIVSISGQYSSAKLSNAINNSNVRVLNGGADILYAKNVTSLWGNSVFFGGHLRFKKNTRRQSNFFFEASSTGESYLSLGPSMSLARNTFDNQLVMIRVYTGLITYLDDLDSVSTPGKRYLTIDKLNDYKFDLKYIIKSNKEMYLSLNYKFEYYRVDRDLFDVRDSGHSFSLGFLVKL